MPLYGVDTGGGGGTGATGPQGPQGPQGLVGPAGPAGSAGATGPAGADGATGPQGPAGPTGPQGIKGDTGLTGPQGAAGTPGTAGAEGPQGLKGDTGLQGPKGDKGDPGNTGLTGNTGPAGPGVPAGGTTGQLLAKSSATDYATQWIAPPTPGAPTANPIFTGNVFMQMGSHTVKSAAATLTAAELLTRYILYSGAAATLTMPTGTLIDTALTAALGSALPNDRAFEFTIGNSGTGTATLGGATGLTLAGPMGVTTGTSATFRVRKVAANTFTVYRA